MWDCDDLMMRYLRLWELTHCWCTAGCKQKWWILPETEWTTYPKSYFFCLTSGYIYYGQSANRLVLQMLGALTCQSVANKRTSPSTILSFSVKTNFREKLLWPCGKNTYKHTCTHSNICTEDHNDVNANPFLLIHIAKSVFHSIVGQ